MIQEYLFTSDEYKTDLESLVVSEKVTKAMIIRIVLLSDWKNKIWGLFLKHFSQIVHL